MKRFRAAAFGGMMLVLGIVIGRKWADVRQASAAAKHVARGFDPIAVSAAQRPSPAASPLSSQEVARPGNHREQTVKDFARETLLSAENRELVARETMKGYGKFLDSLRLSDRAKDTLVDLLIDRNLATTSEEGAEYDALIREMLGEAEYGRYKNFRDELPLRSRNEAALRAMALAAPAGEFALERWKPLVESMPFRGKEVFERAMSPVSTEDIQTAREILKRDLAVALATHGHGLAPSERTALEQWHAEYSERLVFPLRIAEMTAARKRKANQESTP